MSPFPILGHEYVVLHSIIERTSRTRDTHAIIISDSAPLAITQTYAEANDVLEYHKKKITSRKSTADFSLCMWYDTIDGVDIARVPLGRNVVEEVRLKIMGADVWGKQEARDRKNGAESEGDEKLAGAEDGGHGNSNDDGTRTVALHVQGQLHVSTVKDHEEGQSARDSHGRDSRRESCAFNRDGQADNGLGESKDEGEDADDKYVQSDISELQKSPPENQSLDFENTRLCLRNMVPEWRLGGTEVNRGEASNHCQAQAYARASVTLQANGIPILPNGLRASSIDGRVWTVKLDERIPDTTYARCMAETI
ncbi:hypothetical protein BDU57DRAFT_548458 [Ampelomyces quisqualis]|uniref:Uncharacterized protein n=1 Tax=Ampelomyces quisqualis TaxID=50730 RepID=A0A6A5QMI5_AMPQU|nr:hypothetical protein BDU57DRAFT_548458 [Ampelomyces quisqualis]